MTRSVSAGGRVRPARATIGPGRGAARSCGAGPRRRPRRWRPSPAATPAPGNPNYLPSLYPNENVKEFQAIQTHENAHVTYLINAINAAGGTPRPKPSFVNLTQANLLAFAQTSQALENTGVGAYLGAAPYISGGAYVGAAGLDPGHRGAACRLSQRAAQPDHDLQRPAGRPRASRCR